ncbi:hypothetical protein MLD38_033537 [Melastoma candidum]|uniref:Uncharacterized protein n=1 Tax=Melastoma candidum TaxID=119954 RepID=A0ACB9M6S5_9MYRT|nr:hypothetical protein MLD38_033537 [Melastoma candidum]
MTQQTQAEFAIHVLSNGIVLPFIAPSSFGSSISKSVACRIAVPYIPFCQYLLSPWPSIHWQSDRMHTRPQQVSPPIPVFSTFTTEPSTAPITPPESVYLTRPSSPEVPFGQLLTSK